MSDLTKSTNFKCLGFEHGARIPLSQKAWLQCSSLELPVEVWHPVPLSKMAGSVCFDISFLLCLYCKGSCKVRVPMWTAAPMVHDHW